MAFNFSMLGNPLTILGSGLLAAGGPGGWNNLGQGLMAGSQMVSDQQQAQQLREMRDLQKQQLEFETVQQKAAADAKAAEDKAIQDLIGGGMMTASGAPVQQIGNYGASVGGALGPGMLQGGGGGGFFDAQTAERLRQLPPSLQPSAGRAALNAQLGNMFAGPKPRKTTEIAGRLVDAETGEVIKDYSSEEVALRNASRPVTNVTTNLPPQETEFAKMFGKMQAEQAAAISPTADKSRAALDSIAALEKAVGDIQASGGDTGRLAPLVSDLAARAQAIGIDPTSLGLPANAGPYEVATAISNKMALQLIGADAEGGMPANNFSEADRKFVTDIAPNISNTPQGIAAKIEVSKRVNQRNLEAEAMWNSGKYPQTQAGYSQYRKDWAEHVRKNPLFTSDEIKQLRALKGTSSGPDERGGTVIDGYTITPVN